MSIYLNPNLCSFAQLPQDIDEKIEDFWDSEELKKLNEKAEKMGFSIDYWSLENDQVIVFGKKLDGSEAYYEGMLVSLDNFTKYQKSDKEKEEVQLALPKFLAELEDSFAWVKELEWSPVDVYFMTHS